MGNSVFCLKFFSLDVVGGAKEKRLVTLRYPMEVLEMYPSVRGGGGEICFPDFFQIMLFFY